jgi:hypothetical protein
MLKYCTVLCEYKCRKEKKKLFKNATAEEAETNLRYSRYQLTSNATATTTNYKLSSRSYVLHVRKTLMNKLLLKLRLLITTNLDFFPCILHGLAVLRSHHVCTQSSDVIFASSQIIKGVPNVELDTVTVQPNAKNMQAGMMSVQTPSLLRPIFLKRHFVSPHKVIKYMIWSIAAPAAKQFFFVPRVCTIHCALNAG